MLRIMRLKSPSGMQGAWESLVGLSSQWTWSKEEREFSYQIKQTNKKNSEYHNTET